MKRCHFDIEVSQIGIVKIETHDADCEHEAGVGQHESGGGRLVDEDVGTGPVDDRFIDGLEGGVKEECEEDAEDEE